MSARFELRAATADAHLRLDVLFSGFDLTNRDGYGRFLQAQAGAFVGVEAEVDRAGAGEMIEDWEARRRSDALKADLHALGLDVPQGIRVPRLSGEAEVLGAIYVLEGSRLGGAMLIRSVPDGLPKSFLTTGNPLHWRTFVAVIDKRLSSERNRADAARAASAVFDAFAESARATLACALLGDDGT